LILEIKHYYNQSSDSSEFKTAKQNNQIHIQMEQTSLTKGYSKADTVQIGYANASKTLVKGLHFW